MRIRTRARRRARRESQRARERHAIRLGLDGANGYYYAFGPAGSFSSGQSVLAYTTANSTTGATNAATLTSATAASNQTDVNLYGNTLKQTAPGSVGTMLSLNNFYRSAWGAGGVLSGFDPLVAGYNLANRRSRCQRLTSPSTQVSRKQVR